MKNRRTLCWDCKNANPSCCWHNDFTPVDGWIVEPVHIKTDNTDTFLVVECPNFEPENIVIDKQYKDQELAQELGVSLRSIARWKHLHILNEMKKKYKNKGKNT